jgi:hypothetical protein
MKIVAAAVVIVLIVALQGSAATSESAPPTALWYRLTLRFDGTVQSRGGATHVFRHSVWSVESRTAFILRRLGPGNFSFGAGASGDVLSHTGNGLSRRSPGHDGNYCRWTWRERLVPKVVADEPGMDALIGSDSIRYKGIGVDSYAVVQSWRLQGPVVSTATNLDDENCIDERPSPCQVGCLLTTHDLALAPGLKFNTGDFGKKRFVLERTWRKSFGPGPPLRYVFKFKFVFQRCPKQDLSDNCGIPQ